MIRFTRFDRWGNQTGVVNDVIEAVHKDEVNGEDSLTLVLASCDLIKGDRIVWRDRFGEWHEHSVCEVKDIHEEGKLYATVYCENSLAETYTDYIEELRPYKTSAAIALQRALSVTRWEMGTVDVAGTASASFYHTSAREAIASVVENWGGELYTTIKVEGTGVSRRIVNLGTKGGSYGKRFTWTKDMERIERSVSTDDVVTALYGYGKGLEAYDEDGNLTGGYERKLRFGDINNGLDYVADEDAKLRWGHPDGKGGIKHSFGKAEFDDCEDMEELLELTKAELAKRSEPQVAYSANVIDLADAGFSSEDVRAGDAVQIIDGELDERLTGRVLSVERYLFNEQATEITLGNVSHSITDVMSQVKGSLDRLNDHSSLWDAASSISSGYIEGIIASLNNTMNQTGGYTYYEPGEGVITYDKPKNQNPTMAVQIKGAGIRIANSKKSNGDWNWRTFGTGDGFAADCIVTGTMLADRIRAGLLTDEKGLNYWNLSTGEFSLSSATKVGESTVASESDVSDAQDAAEKYADDVSAGAYSNAKSYSDSVTKALDESLTQAEVLARLTNNGAYQGIWLEDGSLYFNGTYIKSGTIDAALVKAGILTDAKGLNYWNMATGEFSLSSTAKVGDSTVASASDVSTAIDSYDEGLTQAEVLARLTNNGALKGIYMANGDLYINGTYIKSGEIDADLITTGKIAAKKGGSYWNLDTGEAVFSLGSGSSVSGYATSSQLSSVKTTADNAASTASSAYSRSSTALSTANTASSNASSARAKTDHITIGTNGVTITGTNGNTVFSTTYGSDGFQTINNVSGISTSEADFGVKDWGLAFTTDAGDVGMWITTNESGLESEPCFNAFFPGGSFRVTKDGAWVNGKKVTTA